MKETEPVLAATEALGSAWRGDWSFFDGRTLRAQLDELCGMIRAAERGEDQTGPVASFYATCGICPKCQQWTENCVCQ